MALIYSDTYLNTIKKKLRIRKIVSENLSLLVFPRKSVRIYGKLELCFALYQYETQHVNGVEKEFKVFLKNSVDIKTPCVTETKSLYERRWIDFEI